jgi:hypothetical protein
MVALGFTRFRDWLFDGLARTVLLVAGKRVHPDNEDISTYD